MQNLKRHVFAATAVITFFSVTLAYATTHLRVVLDT